MGSLDPVQRFACHTVALDHSVYGDVRGWLSTRRNTLMCRLAKSENICDCQQRVRVHKRDIPVSPGQNASRVRAGDKMARPQQANERTQEKRR